MDEKIKILLEKINMEEEFFPYFNDAKIEKIKINPKKKAWNIFITKEDLLPPNVYKSLEEKKTSLDENAKSIEFVWKITNKDISCYHNYYEEYLLETLKKDLKVLEIYRDCMKIEEDALILVVSNESEKSSLEKSLPKIQKFYEQLDYPNTISIEVRKEENILEKIQQEKNH